MPSPVIGSKHQWREQRCDCCNGTGLMREINPDWLRAQRERAHVTLREVARRLGVSAPYICDIERGYRPVPDYVWKVYEAWL